MGINLPEEPRDRGSEGRSRLGLRADYLKIHLEGMRQEISKSFEEKFMRDLLKPIYSEKIVEISQEEFRAELNGSSGG